MSGPRTFALCSVEEALPVVRGPELGVCQGAAVHELVVERLEVPFDNERATGAAAAAAGKKSVSRNAAAEAAAAEAEAEEEEAAATEEDKAEGAAAEEDEEAGVLPALCYQRSRTGLPTGAFLSAPRRARPQGVAPVQQSFRSRSRQGVRQSQVAGLETAPRASGRLSLPPCFCPPHSRRRR